MDLGDPVGFENLEEGRASQRKLAAPSSDAAEFGYSTLSPTVRRPVWAISGGLACLIWETAKRPDADRPWDKLAVEHRLLYTITYLP